MASLNNISFYFIKNYLLKSVLFFRDITVNRTIIRIQKMINFMPFTNKLYDQL